MTVSTVHVSALGGTNVGYRREGELKSELPTVILLHSFSTSTQLYDPQFEDASLVSVCNLLAIDLYGHGATMGLKDSITYWDQAKMILEVMEQLKVEKAYILGTSQGGFVGTRMYLTAPSKVLGLILCGTSLYSETNTLGSWDIHALLAGAMPVLESAVPTPDWVLPQPFTDDVIGSGLGTQATDRQKADFRSNHLAVYGGDDGRKRYLMIIKCLRDRDNLSPEQLASIKVPVLVMHGTADIVYGVALMQKWAAELTSASPLRIEVVEEGTHFLTANKPEFVNKIVVEFLAAAGESLSRPLGSRL